LTNEVCRRQSRGHARGHENRNAQPLVDGDAPLDAMLASKRILLVVGLGVLAAGSWYGWHRWREQQRAVIVKAAVPPIPDLARWPRGYASRVRAATAIANRGEQPVAALSELAGLYHANDCYREAEQVERGLHALDPKNARWTYLLADAGAKLGDVEGQRAFLETTLQLAPYYPTTRIKLAELLLKLGLPDEARAQYEWRLTLAPNDPHARLGLARIALQRGDRASARQILEGITRDHPDFPSAHNLLSEVYASMGEAARADEQRRLSGGTGEWREADDPWLSRVYAWSFDPYRLENLGGARLQTQQLEDAATFYEKAARLAPSDGLTGDALGNVYLQLNELDKAATVLDAAVAAAPPSAALFSTLAQVLQTQGHVTKAIAVLQRGILALPTQSGLRYDLGALLEAKGRREEAVAAYREAVRLNPDFSEAHWNLGLCLLAGGQESEAEENLGRALALRPRNADALIALAQKGLDSGRLGQAACCIHALAAFGTGVPVRQLVERALAAARQAGDPKWSTEFERLLAQAPR